MPAIVPNFIALGPTMYEKSVKRDRQIDRPTKTIKQYKPQSRFARLWLDMIIAESDAATQLTTPDA